MDQKTKHKAELHKLRIHVADTWAKLHGYNRTAALHNMRKNIDTKITDLNREIIFRMPFKRLTDIHDTLKRYLKTQKTNTKKSVSVMEHPDILFQILQKLSDDDIDALQRVSKATHQRTRKYLDNYEYHG